jgi:hypothetical protein
MANEQRDREARDGHDGGEKHSEAPGQAGTRTGTKPGADKGHAEPKKADKGHKPS